MTRKFIKFGKFPYHYGTRQKKGENPDKKLAQNLIVIFEMKFIFKASTSRKHRLNNYFSI